MARKTMRGEGRARAPKGKLSPPFRYQAGLGENGRYFLQTQEYEGGYIDKQNFGQLYELENNLRDLYGAGFANQVVKSIKKHGKVKELNPGISEASEVSEGFHGRPSTYIEDIIEIEKYRTKLAHLGDLIEFEIIDHRSPKYVIPINFAEPDTEDHVSVASTSNRRQLILSGGSQSIDLDSFSDLSDNEKEKDYVTIGSVFSISYFTDKHHLEGPKYQKDGTEYIHKFGEEEGGERPTLVYDKLNEHIILVGGSYEVRDEGIYN
jgi:hypothetical protein